MPVPSRGRVGMVLETAYPPDARVEREALALIDAGYKVYLMCRRYDDGMPEQEIYKGIHITRVDPEKVYKQWHIPGIRFKVKTRFPYRGLCRSVWKRLTGMESDWRHLIKHFVRKNNIDILHVHDLKLLKTSLAVALQQKSVKVVADLHENYPALVGRLTELRKGKVKGREKQLWWEKIERRTLKRVDRILVVVEEARDRILQYPTVVPEKVTVVRNVVDSQKFLSPEVDALTPHLPEGYSERFIMTYVGHINSAHRGIQTVLEALPLVIEQIPNFLFVGAGSVRKNYMQETLEPLIEKYNLRNYVYFSGYCDETEFVPYIKQADICICPHMRTALTDTTFPNKVFLYNLFKKPVIVSSCLPLARYITDTQSGLIYHADDKEALANSILMLYKDAELRKHLGKNGQQWVLSRFNWEKEKQNLLEVYQAL